MSREEEVHPYLRRRVDSCHPQIYTNSDYQRLMWLALYYEKKYDKEELADRLRVACDTLHAYSAGELRFHIDMAPKVNQFIADCDPKDDRFINHFLPKGYVAIPIAGDLHIGLKMVLDVALDIYKKIKKEGEK